MDDLSHKLDVTWSMRRAEKGKSERGRLLRAIGRFYVLAFLISWAGWLPGLLRQWQVPGFSSIFWLGLIALGALGPAMAAWIIDPKIFRAFRRRTRWRWLLGAALMPALPLVTMAVGANIWEEVGWRAYALRRLEEVMPPWVAALTVGVLWAGWHLPLFLAGWSGMTHMPLGWWAIRIVGTSVILTWLFNRTGQTLWGVTVFHIGSNIWAAWTGVWSHWMEAVVVWTVAGILLTLTAGMLGHTSHTERRL